MSTALRRVALALWQEPVHPAPGKSGAGRVGTPLRWEMERSGETEKGRGVKLGEHNTAMPGSERTPREVKLAFPLLRLMIWGNSYFVQSGPHGVHRIPW